MKKIIITLYVLTSFALISMAQDCVPDFAVGLNSVKYFAVAAIIIFFLGLKDDLTDISAFKKLAGQIIAAGIVIRFGNIYISNMHGFLDIYEIPYFASVFLSMFAFIVITNAFNLIDGVDGLASSLGIVTSLTFAIYFYIANEMLFSIMAISLTGSLIAYLIYNYSPAKIFMGDTGSLLLGLINSILVIKFIEVAGVPGNTFSFSSAPAIGFAILIVPLFDTLRVFSVRIINRKSPFSADRIHIHHYLLDLGFSHNSITLICVTTTLFFIGEAFLLRNLNTTLLISILISTAILLKSIVYYNRKKSQKNKKSQKVINSKSKKIFSLLKEPLEVN